MSWMAERIEQLRSSNRERERLVGEIAREFDRAGLPYLVFKGPMLANAVYGDSFLREYSDIDILIDADNFATATDILRQFNFAIPDYNMTELALLRRYHFAIHLENSETGSTIDLHWALLPPRWTAKPDLRQIWVRSTRVDVMDAPVPTLNREDLLLYLCVHASKDGWKQLRTLCDIATLLELQSDWNWDRILSQAQSFGCQRIVLLATLLAARLLNAPVAEHVLAQARRQPVITAMAERIVRLSDKK